MRVQVVFRPVPASQDGEGIVARALREHGLDVVAEHEAVVEDVECVLIYGAPTAYPRVLDGLRRLGDRRPPVAIWQTEPFLHPKASGLPWPRRTPQEWGKLILRDKRAIDGRTNERALVRLQADGLVDLVATSTRGRQERLAEVGVEARLIQMAVRPREPTGAERDIPVLFLGAMSVPRRRWLAWRIKRAGVPLLAVGDWHDPRYWGEQRDRLMDRSLINLNLNRFPGNFADMRFALGAHHRSLIVSEPVYAPDPYVPGVHYVEAEPGDLPEVLMQWLEDEPARQAMVDRTYAMVSEKLSRPVMLDRLVAFARDAAAQRAAG